jgi:ketosteroid isomerase-like protein
VAEPSPPGADDEAAVLAANEAFYAAFNEKDAAAMAALWSARDAVTCVHPGWNVLEGRERVLESWRQILGNPEQPKIVSAARSAWVEGDAAIVVGRELVAGSPIATTNAFVREDGAWKMILHHASPVALS